MRTRPHGFFLASLLFVMGCLSVPGQTPTMFTRLEKIQAKVVRGSDPYPGGRHEMANLIDGIPGTEYSSNGAGTNTTVEFEFQTTSLIAAMLHLDRNDPATIAESELQLFDANGAVVGTYKLIHANLRGGSSFLRLPAPVHAQKARWRVTALGAALGTVGGAEMSFFAPGAPEQQAHDMVLRVAPTRLLQRRAGNREQQIEVWIDYPYLETAEAQVQVGNSKPVTTRLSFGNQLVTINSPPVSRPRSERISVAIAGRQVAEKSFSRGPVEQMDIYLLPHSHVDIGYTALQTEVEKKQDENLEIGLRLAKATASFPEDARFKWNAEVLWPVENYLRAATPAKRTALLGAIKSGQLGLDAFYGNILTGLCRPEELLRLMSYARRLSLEVGVPIESAMISDVPGYTWSTVSAMAQAGVKYFSFAPNYFDRMGGTMKEWQNKPFWWKGPDGKSKVLCWCPSRGYALGHLIGDGPALAAFMPGYLRELETNGYPYQISHLRWNVHGDNGSPDEKVSEVVRDWNARYASPRLIISTTAEAFRQFEKRYGDRLPVYSGDYTPYWEDGAGSSARETALNRATAERLVQAETLWSMRQPGLFPAREFQDAWRGVLLYSEHTWGAHNSINQPDIPFVKDQWRMKQAFAVDASRLSEKILESALEAKTGYDGRDGVLDVYNTRSCERTDLVRVPAELSGAGDRVSTANGTVIPSQRLSTGELVFVARDVPALGARRFQIQKGSCPSNGAVKATLAGLEHPLYSLKIEPTTGSISSLIDRSTGKEFVDLKAGIGLNEYLYLPGANTNAVQKNGKVKVTIKENGPLLASLLIESQAPGCRSLTREIWVVDGLDRIEILNTVDKLPVREKEGVHFGYGFNVPDGAVRMDVGWAMVRPEVDQIPAACKNWFSVQRWVDISNLDSGITWCPIDTPLVQVGGLTANLIGSQTDPRVWIQHLPPSQSLYAWVMNNHWHTNYRADQEGPTVFRFVLQPHKGFAAEKAAQLGASASQPLIVARATSVPVPEPPVRVPDSVTITAFKPSDDGKARIIRLFGSSGTSQRVKLTWAKPEPRKIWLSDLGEQPLKKAGDEIEVPAWGIVTLRAEYAGWAMTNVR